MRNQRLWHFGHELVGGLRRCFWFCVLSAPLTLIISNNAFADEIKVFPNYMASFLWKNGSLQRIDSSNDCSKDGACLNIVQLQFDNSAYASNKWDNILSCCTTDGGRLIEKIHSSGKVAFYREKYGNNKSFYFIVKQKNGASFEKRVGSRATRFD